MMWGWSAFIFFLKLYLPEGSHPNREILVGKIQTPGHMMLILIPQSHLHTVLQNKDHSAIRHILTRCGMLYVISVNTYLAVSVPSKILSSANTSFIGTRSSRTGGIFNRILAASTACLVA